MPGLQEKEILLERSPDPSSSFSDMTLMLALRRYRYVSLSGLTPPALGPCGRPHKLSAAQRQCRPLERQNSLPSINFRCENIYVSQTRCTYICIYSARLNSDEWQASMQVRSHQLGSEAGGAGRAGQAVQHGEQGNTATAAVIRYL